MILLNVKSFPKYKSWLFSSFYKNIYYVIFDDLYFSENIDCVCAKYTGDYTYMYNCVLSMSIEVKKMTFLLVVVKKKQSNQRNILCCSV